MPNIICGGDVHTPDAAATALTAIADTYRNLLASIDQSSVNQTAMGITGAPLDMLAAMSDAAVIAIAAAQDGAEEAHRQAQKVADTVGADPSLAGTQAGNWMDPRRTDPA